MKTIYLSARLQPSKMKNYYFFLLLLMIFPTREMVAQVGIGTLTPEGAVDVSSTTNGLLVPRVNLTAKNSASPIVNPNGGGAPVEGTLVYNKAAAGTGVNVIGKGFYYWENSEWNAFTGVGSKEWAITGNDNINATTNFLGSINAADLVFKTANTNRFRISNANSGQLQSHYAGTATLPTYSFFGDPNTGLYNPLGDRISFVTAGLDRVIINESGTVGLNIVGYSDSQLSIEPTDIVKSGIYVDVDVDSGANGTTQNTNDGVISFANSKQGFGSGWFLNIAGGDGDGYGSSNMGYGILGSTSGTGLYKAGVMGTASNGRRNAGVFGSISNAASTIFHWGALGYRPSTGATYYGGYFSTQTTGAGKTTLSETQNIGIGSYGDYMGGWIKGENYGLTTSGKGFGLFVDGKSYHNDAAVQLTNTPDGKTIASYAQTSITMDVTSKGKAAISNGNTKVIFNEDFLAFSKTADEVIITITPLGECNGLFIASQDEKGFVVKELQSGRSNVNFYWTAIASTANKNKEEIENVIKFQKNDLSKIMINESENTSAPVQKTAQKRERKKLK